MNKPILFLLAFLSSITTAATCHAQASFFDPTFGTGGKTIVQYGGISGGVFEAIAQQPNGKLVTAGVINLGSVIARFNEDGSPDSSFANNGFYVFPSSDEILYDLTLQPDGKILAEGSNAVSIGNIQFRTIRLNTDGTPDLGFGSGGFASIDFGPFSNDYGYALALQPDGKIVIGGEKSENMAIARLKSDGVLDSTFGINGLIIGPYGKLRGIDIAADGTILVGGHSTAAKHYALMAVRYLPNGILDTSFNHNGIAYTIAGLPDGNFGKALKIQPDGKILLAGSGNFTSGGGNFVVVRYNTNGTLDGSFGAGGIADIDFYGGDDAAWGMDLAPDGTILLAGITGNVVVFAATRLRPDGSLDNTFGNDGRIINPVRGWADYARCIVRQTDGRIAIAGVSLADTVTNHSDAVIARFLPTPAGVSKLDESFNGQLLYPNPAKHSLHVKESTGRRINDIFSTDVLGNKMNMIKHTAGQIIDVRNMPNGLYLFTIVYDDGTRLSQKIWVQQDI
jgi:uncharacterized delta-60 repeat protein